MLMMLQKTYEIIFVDEESKFIQEGYLNQYEISK